MNCKFCDKKCQKAGKQKNCTQKLDCRVCKKYQQFDYRYQIYKQSIFHLIPQLVCESVGIRGIARILKIAASTVIGKIKLIAASICKPFVPLNRAAFELDEERTYIKI